MVKRTVPAQKGLISILRWFVEFLIVCSSCRVFVGAFFLIHSFYPTVINDHLLFWIFIGVPVALILFGIANLLQIADIVYSWKGVVNPAIARDSYQDFGKRANQNRRIGLLLGLSGLALLFGFAPSLALLLYFLNSKVATFVGEVFFLLLLIIVYRKMLR